MFLFFILCIIVCFTQHQESVKVVYLLLRSFAVRLIGSCDTFLAVLESMLATFISPISTTLMTQSFLLMIQRNGTTFFEILRHQQPLYPIFWIFVLCQFVWRPITKRAVVGRGGKAWVGREGRAGRRSGKYCLSQAER